MRYDIWDDAPRLATGEHPEPSFAGFVLTAAVALGVIVVLAMALTSLGIPWAALD